MNKFIFKKSIALISMITFVLCPVASKANEITKSEVKNDQIFEVEGNLSENISDILVNLWLYKDGEIIAVKQANTLNGKYYFSVNLGNVLTGSYKIKTIAQIENADSETIEHFNMEELNEIYKDIFNHKNDTTYLTQKFQGDYKKYLIFTNDYFAGLFKNGKTSDVVDILTNELEPQKSFQVEEVKKTLNYVAVIKMIENTSDADAIVKVLLDQDAKTQTNNRAFLGLENNSVLSQFEANIKSKIGKGLTREEEFAEIKNSFNNFAENLISLKLHYSSRNDFVSKVEEGVIITDINNCRGKDSLLKVIEDYAVSTNKLDLTIFNNADNNKDEVIKNILLGVEKKQIKTISKIQEMLNTNIKPSAGKPTSSGGGTGVISVPLPETNFNEDELVIPDVINFKDMDGYAWAEESVDNLVKKGMINGYSNNVFAPGENVTRAQFAKMLCNVFDISPAIGENIFTDVPLDAWYADCVTSLYKAGYIYGIGNSKFGSDEPISRQDAFVIIYRILKDNNLLKNEISVADFDDWENVSEYAKIPIATLSEMKLIQGDNGNVKPNESIKRAEGAVIMYRVYEEAKK